MQSLLDNLSTLFSFLITQLGNLANFFINTTLGQIILGLVIFGIIASFLYNFISNIHK